MLIIILSITLFIAYFPSINSEIEFMIKQYDIKHWKIQYSKRHLLCWNVAVGSWIYGKCL